MTSGRGSAETGRSLGLGKLNVADIVTPWFNENLCLEKKGEKNKNRIGERRHPDVNVWPSGALQ